MTATTRSIIDGFTGNKLPVIRATTAALATNYPFLHETGIIDPATGRKVPGLPIGTCGPDGSGGVMFWDPVQIYKAKGLKIEDTNVNVLGKVGQQKSSGVKGEIVLNAEIGRNTIVTDIKGEYLALADFIRGSKVMRFGADDSLRLNLLDNRMSVHRQHRLSMDVVLSALGTGRTHLTTLERDALWHGIIAAHDRSDAPLLKDLLDEIENPRDVLITEVIGARKRARNEFVQGVKELRSVLKRLHSGDLHGTFHEHTTEGLFDVVPLLVLLCKDLTPEQQNVMMVILNFLIYEVVDKQKLSQKRFDFIVHDEAWKLVQNPAFLRSIVELYKLGNSQGISNKLVTHHASNLYASGNEKLVDALFADASTSIIYHQERSEIERYADVFGLNEREIDIVADMLDPGEALYKLGDLPGIRVQHRVTNHPKLRPLVETREHLVA